MDKNDLQQFIDAYKISATLISLNEHTRTVSDAARALGVETEQIVKTLVFHINNEPFLVINNGTARVDRKKLAAYMGVGRKKVKFADPDQALDITGFIVGGMPPFGHKLKLRTLIDPAVTRLEILFGGGGDINAMMRTTPDELLKVTKAEVTALSDD